jgi:hypothetical protein
MSGSSVWPPSQHGSIRGDTEGIRAERARSAQGRSEIDLFRDGKGIINFNAEIPDGALNLGMAVSSCTARRLPVRR